MRTWLGTRCRTGSTIPSGSGTSTVYKRFMRSNTPRNHTFEQAEHRGIAKILALPSTDSKEFEDIKNREELRFPELRSRQHRYFAERFARRYERRCTEIALADVIVANSEVTRRSHIRAGADPEKIVAVPLAAPPGIEAIVKPVTDIDQPLSVVWAGSMIIRKGAHYFLDAWRALDAGKSCVRAGLRQHGVARAGLASGSKRARVDGIGAASRICSRRLKEPIFSSFRPWQTGSDWSSPRRFPAGSP